jgi:C4-dicarboxylate-specific signal transduction histidine kinase
MKGRELSLQIEQDSESVRINVSDSGNGFIKTILKLYLNPVYN